MHRGKLLVIVRILDLAAVKPILIPAGSGGTDINVTHGHQSRR